MQEVLTVHGRRKYRFFLPQFSNQLCRELYKDQSSNVKTEKDIGEDLLQNTQNSPVKGKCLTTSLWNIATDRENLFQSFVIGMASKCSYIIEYSIYSFLVAV